MEQLKPFVSSWSKAASFAGSVPKWELETRVIQQKEHQMVYGTYSLTRTEHGVFP